MVVGCTNQFYGSATVSAVTSTDFSASQLIFRKKISLRRLIKRAFTRFISRFWPTPQTAQNVSQNHKMESSSKCFCFRPPSKMIGAKSAGFFISMCDDVLAEVLSSGNRKQLVILTKNGKRFSRLVDRFFVSAPFLRMDIDLWDFGFVSE